MPGSGCLVNCALKYPVSTPSKRSRRSARSLPLKWLKYELLDLYGLADLVYIERSIRRFRREDSSYFLSELRREIRGSGSLNTSQRLDGFFVTKLVPHRLSILLTNVRVYGLRDIPAVQRAISEPNSDHEEIWLCRTRADIRTLSVAGRLLVLADCGSQVIEQVWRCSPRFIENLGPDFPYPFVRAVRPGWGWSMKIEEIHCTPNAPETGCALRCQLGATLRKLNASRERLEFFTDAITSLGLAISLEYKIEGEALQIIDWDTANDALVLDSLLPHE